MTRLSSNWTLFFKLFVPTFWVVFFGAMCLAILLTDPGNMSFFKSVASRWILFACYLIFFAFLYFTLMRLVRVDFDAEHLYISNYFKTYKYPVNAIDHVARENYGLFKLIKVHFKAETKFGKTIYCLPSKVGYEILQNTESIPTS